MLIILFLLVACPLYGKTGTEFHLKASGKFHLARSLDLILGIVLHCDVPSCSSAVYRTASRHVVGKHILRLLKVGVL